jgi:hypothetical protein
MEDKESTKSPSPKKIKVPDLILEKLANNDLNGSPYK